MTQCIKCHTPLPANSRFCFVCGTDQTAGADAQATGPVEGLQARLQRIVAGEYQIERMLGRGGMGMVFLAQDLTLEREVAIKVLPPDFSTDPQVIKRFQQEAKTAAKLDHPNIIPIYRVESAEGLNFFVMKFISGTSLEDVLETRQPLSYDYVQRVLWEAACALGHAHSRHVVHRDVKPANIMFDHDGRVMLTDFGISKALQSAGGLTGTGMIVGTPHYMAPEQAKGQPVDGRADQYSLGIVGYRLLAGSLPFSGDSVHTILYKHIFEPAPKVSALRTGIPRYLTEPIQRSLSKEPSDRFPTMEAFAQAVWPEQAVPTTGKSTPRPGARRPAAPGPVSSDTPTEHVAATADATTPLPTPSAPLPATVRTARRSKVPLAALVIFALAATGVAGYLGLRGRGAAVPLTPLDSSAIAQLPETTTESAQSTATVLPRDIPETTVARAPTQALSTPAPPLRTTPTRAERPAPPAAPSGADGYLEIDSDPTAELFLDGVDMGPTPLFHHRLRPGRHTLRIEASGYQTQRVSVQVEAGRTFTKRYKLNPE
ncbi:MAG TPA: protein kinase [Gemmatimonadales bacterium]|nr:protein kinase [Gemmatimonadales bacterium]